MIKIEKGFGIHEDGLPGPEEISEEESRVGEKRGIHSRGARGKPPFLNPEDIPSDYADPLEALIAKEENNEKGKRPEKSEESGYSTYDPENRREEKARRPTA